MHTQDGEPINLAPQLWPPAEATPDPEGPGPVYNHREEANSERTFSSRNGINAFTMQCPDGTASWCFAYIVGNGPGIECKDVPEGWDK